MASKAANTAEATETRDEAAEAPLLDIRRRRYQKDAGARPGARLRDL